MTLKNLVLGFISICYLFACTKAPLYSSTHEFKNAIWQDNDTLHFEWEVTDTNNLYNLNLNVKHGADYKYQNLYVKFITGFPDGTVKDQLLSIELFKADGKPNGKCSSNSCVSEISLGEKLAFPQLGKYNISINAFSRDSMSNNIQSAELIIMESNN